MRNSAIVVGIVALGLSMGARNANAARIVTANETTNLVPDFTILTDSVVGLLCNADEDTTACFAPAYVVAPSLISTAFPNGGFAGVDLRDGPGSDHPGLLSDQLYLNVTPVLVAPGFNVQWCWDSDLEPDVNICQFPGQNGWPGIPAGFTAVQLVEPGFGFLDVTAFFSGAAGPLAAGQWQILAQSEVPEPTPLFLLGGGLVVGALCLRKRYVSPPDDLPEATAGQ
jgi:hypothetical protein